MAERIACQLGEHGVPTFYSRRNLLGAQQWQDEMLAALQRCDWFIVLLSVDAVASMWVRREVAVALSDPKSENRIIPLMYRPCDLESLAWLQIFQMIDFQGEFRDGMRDLLRVWGLGLRA